MNELETIFKKLPKEEDIRLAMMANGGVEYNEKYCECDPSVGMVPCQYCAIDSVLRRLLNTVEEMKEKKGGL